LRELIIMRVAELNAAKYEADQHTPYAIKEGVSVDQLAALSNWSESNLFSVTQKNVLALTDAMTENVVVPDRIFDSLKSDFENREIVELTATIAAYNMVSRFLVATSIASSDQFDGG
jgi:AhpD family alkylhydroperoxidase